MNVNQAADLLSQAIQESPEYIEYKTRKEVIDADAPIKALVDEYKRLQTLVQMRMLAGQGMQQDEDSQRFQQLSALLFADQRTSTYLLAEIRLQQMMAQVFETLTRAADMNIPLPQ